MSPIWIGDIQMVRETETTTTKIGIGADITGRGQHSGEIYKKLCWNIFRRLEKGVAKNKLIILGKTKLTVSVHSVWA